MTNNVIGFFGHATNKYGVFSNWYPVDIVIPEHIYEYNGNSWIIPEHSVHSTEQSMMYCKEVLFGLKNGLGSVLDMQPPAGNSVNSWKIYQKNIKAAGRNNIAKFDEEIWNALRYNVVKWANTQKFTYNEYARNILLETGNAIIAEASPYDKIWGIGLGVNNTNIQNPLRWQGMNLLGLILMEIREELRSNI